MAADKVQQALRVSESLHWYRGHSTARHAKLPLNNARLAKAVLKAAQEVIHFHRLPFSHHLQSLLLVAPNDDVHAKWGCNVVHSVCTTALQIHELQPRVPPWLQHPAISTATCKASAELWCCTYVYWRCQLHCKQYSDAARANASSMDGPSGD